jgi:hypothetical protein
VIGAWPGSHPRQDPADETSLAQRFLWDAEVTMGSVARRDSPSASDLLVAHVLQRVPKLADELVQTILKKNPGYSQFTVVPSDELWQSAHDNLTRIVQMIAEAYQPGDTGPPDYFDAARATGQRRAEQRMPLDDVLKSFRLACQLVWEALMTDAREQGTVGTDVLLNMASRVWEVMDEASARLAASYHQAERRLLLVDEQRRATLWEGLLHGRARDGAFAHDAAHTFGIPVDGPYVAVVVDTGGTSHHGHRTDGTASRLTRRLARARIESTWQARADTLVGLVALDDIAEDVAIAALREVLKAPAGVSGVVSGLAEADVAFWQATLARRTLPADRVEVVTLEQRLPEALLLSSPDLALRLIRRWLGPLMKVPAAERRQLTDTLETWLLSGGSVRRTAELAHCHRNTVINRLHRIQQMTGHDFTSGDFQLELGLALRAARLWPPTHPG